MARYDLHTALIVVDVQNDFTDPAGSLSVPGGEARLPAINAEIAAAEAAGALVVATQDWHPDSTPHFAKDGGPWPVHCVAGTWGAALHPDLAIAPDAPRVHKGVDGEDGYSGFTVRHPVDGTTQPTAMDGLLRAASVHRVVVIGLATDYCVRATTLDAIASGYETATILAAIGAVDVEPGDGDRAIIEMAEAGVTILDD